MLRAGMHFCEATTLLLIILIPPPEMSVDALCQEVKHVTAELERCKTTGGATTAATNTSRGGGLFSPSLLNPPSIRGAVEIALQRL